MRPKQRVKVALSAALEQLPGIGRRRVLPINPHEQVATADQRGAKTGRWHTTAARGLDQ